MANIETIQAFDPAAGLSLTAQSVDESNGIIHGVSIATSGVRATGHELDILDDDGNIVESREWWTDAETLQSILACANEIGEPLKAKLEHGSGLREVVGSFDNLRIEGDHLRGDLRLAKTSAHGSHIMELAKSMPKQFGISVTAKMIRERSGDYDLMRCSEIYSADFVDDPAINDGLFSARFDKSKKELYAKLNDKRNVKPNTTMTKEELSEIVQAEIKSAMETVTDKLTSYEDRLKTLETPKEELEQKDEELEEKPDEMAEKFAEMSAKIESLKTELSSKLSEFSALGIKRGAAPGENDTPPAKVFATELSAKVKAGKPYHRAIQELNAEHPELVKAELSKRGLASVNLL